MPPNERPTSNGISISAIKAAIERYLLLWLFVLCGVAFFSDRILPVDVFLASKPFLPWLIVVTMFAIGWMLPHDEVRQLAARWPSVFGGTAVQYLTMPLLAYILATQFQLPETLFIGMMLVGCVPGAMASNVLTLMARGNTGYSVSLTTTATLLSPLAVPFALRVTLNETVDVARFYDAAVQLSWTVVLPVIAGHSISRMQHGNGQKGTELGSIIANLTILWIVAYVVAANRHRLLDMRPTLLTALLALNLLGYTAGLTAGSVMRLPPGMKRALTLEVGMQNAGLGTVLATSLFSDPSVAIPPALYTFGCMLSGTVLARFWSSR